MKNIRRNYFAAPTALVFALLLSFAHVSPTSALSLSDVTNTLGTVLGLNNTQNTEQVPEQTPQSTPAQTSTAQQPNTTPTQTTSQPAVNSTTPVNTNSTNRATTLTTANSPAQKVQAVTPAVSDTGAIVRQLASAQTNRAIIPASYSSSRIGSDIRDELFAVSSVTVIVGMALYAMTYLGSSRSVTVQQRRPLYIK